MDPEQIQPQRIHADAKARERHGSRADHRIDPDTGVDPRRHRNENHIVGKCPEQVLVDVAERRPGQPHRRRDVRQLRIHQHDIRRIDRYIGACADRDAGVRPGECRRVVDAVADHRHPAPLLQLPDDRFLSVRQHACDDAVHTGLLSDGSRRALIVAGQHHDLDAHLLQLLHRLRGIRLDHIGHRDDAEKLSVFLKIQRRLALLSQCIRFLCKIRRDGSERRDEPPGPSVQHMPVQFPHQSVA